MFPEDVRKPLYAFAFGQAKYAKFKIYQNQIAYFTNINAQI